jgi:hypothetical protein
MGCQLSVRAGTVLPFITAIQEKPVQLFIEKFPPPQQFSLQFSGCWFFTDN